jgi:cysteine desulfurase / selenocysteine lyase
MGPKHKPNHKRIYLDNAATSFPKPPQVHEAMLRFATELGASPGRGAYAESIAAAEILNTCRQRLNTLINGQDPSHIVFTLNATDALNLAIKGLLAPGRAGSGGVGFQPAGFGGAGFQPAGLGRAGFQPASSPLPDGSRPLHAIATAMDHNSILRPLNALVGPRVQWTCIRADPHTGLVNPEDIARAIRPDTALIAANHASNVTGTLQPIPDIARIARQAGIPLLVDAAQSLGHIPVDVQAMGIDLLAFPGHKGLLGPLGTGGLYIRPGLEERLAPLREGGTGTVSESDKHPQSLPEKYEPGSHNMVGIAGLSASLAWILGRGVDSIREHELALIRLMLDRIEALEGSGLRLIGPRDPDRRVGVFSIAHETIDPDELARRLEADHGVLVRAGIHCAPHAHTAMGTAAAGGAVRLSLGPFLTEADVDHACRALEQVCVAAPRPAV